MYRSQPICATVLMGTFGQIRVCLSTLPLFGPLFFSFLSPDHVSKFLFSSPYRAILGGRITSSAPLWQLIKFKDTRQSDSIWIILTPATVAFQIEMLPEPIEKVTPVEHEDLPQDEDSLFGSPPPSPLARGRSPSPALALPSAASAGPQCWGFGPSAQNVGTIALPGSHTNSEPPINPIASSLSLPGDSCIPLIPQSLPSSQPQSRQGSIARSEPSRARPSVEVRKPTQAHKQALKYKSRTTNARPPPPAIPLPDPSEPPPTHFLRNQQALLGHAGLIAGVRPSKLTTLSSAGRGATPSNPIVLDDNDTETCEPSVLMGRSNIEYFKNLDPSQLPTPTTQEVVDMLIKLKDIFPVLQSILKLLASGATGRQGQGTSTATKTRGWTSYSGQRQVLAQPPAKRRKLNRVPAGAADWDVPYPFLDGEGPKAYRQNWMKERGRQLVSQLIGLVKVALEKAAAKKHVEELALREKSERKQSRDRSVLMDQRAGGRGANHYRDQCRDVTVSPTPSKVVEVSSWASTIDPKSLAGLTFKPELGSPPTPTTASLDNPTFNDLLSALLSASDPVHSNASTSQVLAPSEPLDLSHSTNNFLAALALPSSTNETADQSLVDSWMNILQTFSLPADGPTASGAFLSDDISLESLLGMSTPSDFSAFASPDPGDATSFSTTPNPEATQTPGSPPLDSNQVGNIHLTPNFTASGAPGATAGHTQVPADIGFDFSTPSSDPGLGYTQSAHATGTSMVVDKSVQLSTSPKLQIAPASNPPPQPLPMDIDTLIDPRLLAISLPNTSQAGASGSQPLPSTSNTDSQMPFNSLPSPASTLEPVTPGPADWDMGLPGVVFGEQPNARDFGGQPPMSEVGIEIASPDDLINTSGNGRLQKPKSRFIPPDPPVLPSSSTSVAPVTQPSTGIFSVVRVEDWQPQKPKRKLKKTDVLKKAEEKREKLRASLDETKVKLWETTIEHGTLLQLMRIVGEEGRATSSSLPGS